MPPSETGSSSRPRSRLWGELTGEVVPSGTAICLSRDASENLSQATRQQVYSKSEYKQDCALLLLLHHERERYADMVTYISEYDLAAAVGVWRVESAREKPDLQARAEAELHGLQSPASNSRTFKQWLDRFRKGPTAVEEDPLATHLIQFDEAEILGDDHASRAPPILTRDDAQDMARRLQRLEQIFSSRSRVRPSASTASEPMMMGARGGDSSVLPARTVTADRRRTTVPGRPSEPSAPMPPAATDIPYGRTAYPTRPFSSRTTRTEPAAGSNPANLFQSRESRLRPNDVMLYDPVETNVTFFTRRCHQIAELEGERAVLRVLPMCLKGEALEWYTSLGAELRNKMNLSLAEWESQLLRQFRPNKFDALREAEKLEFHFDRAGSLPLNQYFTKKINLLENAGITDPADIVQHLHTGLDAHLALVTQYNDNTPVDEFIRICRFREPTARRVWNIGRRTRVATRPLARQLVAPTRRSPRAQARKKQTPKVITNGMEG